MSKIVYLDREANKNEFAQFLKSIGNPKKYYENSLKLHIECKKGQLFKSNTNEANKSHKMDTCVAANDIFYATSVGMYIQKFQKVIDTDKSVIYLPVNPKKMYPDVNIFDGAKDVAIGVEMVHVTEAQALRALYNGLFNIGKGESIMLENFNTENFYCPDERVLRDDENGFYNFPDNLVFSGKNNREIQLTIDDSLAQLIDGATDSKGVARSFVNIIQFQFKGYRVPDAAEAFENWKKNNK